MNDKRFQRFYQSGPHFRIENPHPAWAKMRGFVWNRQDCVIRSLANAMSISWLEAYDYLVAKGRKDLYTPTDSDGFRKWITEDGGEWVACKAVKGKKRMTAMQFAETHPEGRFVVYIAGHFTSCVNGVLLDSWNCGESAVVGYFDLKNFKM